MILLEKSVGREYMFNDFMYIGNIVGENGHNESDKASEILAMSCRGSEPRKFKN